MVTNFLKMYDLKNYKQMDLTKYIPYFEKMRPGDRIALNNFNDPEKLKNAGKLCIDLGYPILFSNDYLEIVRIKPFAIPEVCLNFLS